MKILDRPCISCVPAFILKKKNDLLVIITRDIPFSMGQTLMKFEPALMSASRYNDRCQS